MPLNEDGQSPPKKKFKDYSIGYLHVDFAEVRTEEGRQYLFVAIDRTSKVAFAELHPRATRMVAADFLRRVLEKLSYKVHIVLTDNGVQFTLQPHQWFPDAGSWSALLPGSPASVSGLSITSSPPLARNLVAGR